MDSDTLPLFRVSWDNENATGTFPYWFTSRQQAERWARDWKREMIATETTPAGRREARQAYSWEVYEHAVPVAAMIEILTAIASTDSPLADAASHSPWIRARQGEAAALLVRINQTP